MWVAPDGVAHTVALPDPTSAMQEDLTEFITSLAEDDRVALSLRILELEDEVFALIHREDDGIPTAPDGVGLPDGYLHGGFESLGDIGDYLGKIELPWQLDTLTAVQGLFDSLDEV
jgi:hypothetical protein